MRGAFDSRGELDTFLIRGSERILEGVDFVEVYSGAGDGNRIVCSV
jgi:hypothetical protein